MFIGVNGIASSYKLRHAQLIHDGIAERNKIFHKKFSWLQTLLSNGKFVFFRPYWGRYKYRYSTIGNGFVIHKTLEKVGKDECLLRRLQRYV